MEWPEWQPASELCLLLWFPTPQTDVQWRFRARSQKLYSWLVKSNGANRASNHSSSPKGPSLIISVTGSALPFELRSHFYSLFTQVRPMAPTRHSIVHIALCTYRDRAS